MTAMLMDGKKLAEQILNELQKQIRRQGLKPALAIVLCGNKEESVLYTNLKKKRGEEIGISVIVHHFPESIPEEQLIQQIMTIAENVDGIIVQLPLPLHLSKRAVLDSILPEKDVDCLCSQNLGRAMGGTPAFLPATVQGVVRLLQEYAIPLKGKHAVIVNHSELIGKPLAMLLLQEGATVTVCHEFTEHLASHTRTADVLISGVGIPGLITPEKVKQGAVVIDVGIAKTGLGVMGDADFERVKEKAAYITPVPGGIGPMTVAMLLENVVKTVCRK